MSDYISKLEKWAKNPDNLKGYYSTISELERSLEDPKKYVTGLILNEIAHDSFSPLYYKEEELDRTLRYVFKRLAKFNREGELGEYATKLIEEFRGMKHLEPNKISRDEMDKIYNGLEFVNEYNTIIFIDHKRKDANNVIYSGKIAEDYKVNIAFYNPHIYFVNPFEGHIDIGLEKIKRNFVIADKFEGKFGGELSEVIDLMLASNVVSIDNNRLMDMYMDKDLYSEESRKLRTLMFYGLYPVAASERNDDSQGSALFYYILFDHMYRNLHGKNIRNIMKDISEAVEGTEDWGKNYEIPEIVSEDLYEPLSKFVVFLYDSIALYLPFWEGSIEDKIFYGVKDSRGRFIFGEEKSNFSVSFDESMFRYGEKIIKDLKDKLKEIKDVGTPVIVKRISGDIGIPILGYKIAELTDADKIYFYNPRKINRVPKDLPTDVTLFYDTTITGTGIEEAMKDMEDRNVNAVSIFDLSGKKIKNHFPVYRIDRKKLDNNIEKWYKAIESGKYKIEKTDREGVFHIKLDDEKLQKELEEESFLL